LRCSVGPPLRFRIALQRPHVDFMFAPLHERFPPRLLQHVSRNVWVIQLQQIQFALGQGGLPRLTNLRGQLGKAVTEAKPLKWDISIQPGMRHLKKASTTCVAAEQ
jgi:hypothetical protein